MVTLPMRPTTDDYNPCHARYCGRWAQHPYKLFLQLEEIEQRTTQVGRLSLPGAPHPHSLGRRPGAPWFLGQFSPYPRRGRSGHRPFSDNCQVTTVWPQIDDSAGVRIVSYEGTPTADATFLFPVEPPYCHGANPGDYAFQGLHVGRLLPDGSAVVSDAWNAELVAFGQDGTTHQVLATEGPD